MSLINLAYADAYASAARCRPNYAAETEAKTIAFDAQARNLKPGEYLQGPRGFAYRDKGGIWYGCGRFAAGAICGGRPLTEDEFTSATHMAG